MAPRIGRSRLPELLASRKLSQAELARRLGLSTSFISQIVTGKAFFSYETAKAAARILGCSMEELHEWPEEEGNR